MARHGITGDFRGLTMLIHQTRKLTQPGWRKSLNRHLAEEALEQIALGFELQRDPYGVAWPKSRRATEQSGQTLRDTGRLTRSFTHKISTQSGFKVGTNVSYAAPHQDGYTIKVAKGGKRNRAGEPYRVLPIKRGRGKPAFRVIKSDLVVPARQMVPGEGLGPIWSKAFEDATTDFLEEGFNG